MTNRRPKHTRKDANHAEIVRDLRDDGYTVVDVSDLPGKRLDVFVGQEGAPVVVVCSAAGFRRYLEQRGHLWDGATRARLWNGQSFDSATGIGDIDGDGIGEYLLAFEAASVLLLVALVGAAMIVRRKKDA